MIASLAKQPLSRIFMPAMPAVRIMQQRHSQNRRSGGIGKIGEPKMF
jgi:hypothetical protein